MITLNEIEKTEIALQCCLISGRMLTDRMSHDNLEERVLAAIGSEHPEWVDESGKCEPCITEYRSHLKRRAIRLEEERERQSRKRRWLSGLIEGVKRRRRREWCDTSATSCRAITLSALILSLRGKDEREIMRRSDNKGGRRVSRSAASTQARVIFER